MDFPAYVPVAVRTHITTLIYGDSSDPHGWAASLANADKAFARIDKEIDMYTPRGEDSYLRSLRIQKAEAQSHRDQLAAEVECLQRLGCDPRMRNAFALLTTEFTDDQEWRSFIRAAWAARMDFKKYRDRLKRAAELKDEIAQAAKTLAKLIREFSETGINGPDELYSIPELLRQTDNHEMQGHNLDMWRRMRHYILGDQPVWDLPETKSCGAGGDPVAHNGTETTVIYGERKVGPEEEQRNMLHYAWGTAPEFSALLDTVARASLAFSPSESGMIGAAIESRQHSAQTEYIRAFGSLLVDSHGFKLTYPIMKAMEIVANVVNSQPAVDMSYDEVQKALKRYRKVSPENSDKK